MISLDSFFQHLKSLGVSFVAGVPDTLLNDFCLGLDEYWPCPAHVIAANEGNAIALAAGHHLATASVPLVYMQNSGIGNAVNPLISLTDAAVYSIPLVLLIGWRGEPGSADWPQHQRQGELSPVLLDAMNIPYRILDPDENQVMEATSWAVEAARVSNQPTALLVRKGVLALKEKAGSDDVVQTYTVSREDAIRTILASAPEDAIYVASTGRITRELHAIREELGQSHARDFLNVGAMGHALSIAAGIAAARPDRHVICLDGDGAAIMHLGSLIVTANLPVPNLIHIVLNNGAHESVGGQPTTGHQGDLTALAAAAGYHTQSTFVHSTDQLSNAVATVLRSHRPSFIEMRIRKGMRSDIPILRMTPLTAKSQFMDKMNEVSHSPIDSNVHPNKLTAIVLGGTAPHAELCRLLKARGYRTILVDYLQNPPAKSAADIHIRESTLESDKVFEIACDFNADLVISTCVDQANVTACDVMSRIGKIPPYTLATALKTSNKVMMKNIMLEHGIPTSRFVRVSDISSADFTALCFPLIVKPCDSNGSKGVRLCESKKDISKYLPEALAISRTGEGIVEEFKFGREIAFDSYVLDGKTHIIITRERRKIRSSSDTVQQIFGSFWPASLSSAIEAKLSEIGDRIASAFQLDNTPLMVQAIVNGDEVHVIEFAPRIGGGENYKIIKMATGFDLISASIDSFHGVRPEIRLDKQPGFILDNYLYAKPSVFGRVDGLERLFAKGLISSFDVYKLPGSTIGREFSSNNRVAAFTVSASTEAEGVEKISRAVESIEIYDLVEMPVMIRDIYS